MARHTLAQIFICSSHSQCGIWPFPGYLLLSCSIHPVLIGKRQWMIELIGKGGCQILEVLVFHLIKVGNLGGVKKMNASRSLAVKAPCACSWSKTMLFHLVERRHFGLTAGQPIAGTKTASFHLSEMVRFGLTVQWLAVGPKCTISLKWNGAILAPAVGFPCSQSKTVPFH